jgi:hypothetical protein
LGNQISEKRKAVDFILSEKIAERLAAQKFIGQVYESYQSEYFVPSKAVPADFE